ncbi:glycosyltransferase family 4 protein [Glacieibacterium megasporae]|uniref:glycosyltransferase family 4 protein n=1 Tax=Glacieibacterium megasporae TaxID=2835787 RepID=UPI001C1E0349|nr:glycosyltransferase family 4 protein [Polymorphobacter megasporae]UAJ10532.1 glycosyltransferase family 4 protein [Polymorphobacter megasporae]
MRATLDDERGVQPFVSLEGAEADPPVGFDELPSAPIPLSRAERTIRRVALIGTFPPRRCGIATFTSDFQQALNALEPEVETVTLAMSDPGHTHDYGREVAVEIARDRVTAYSAAADFLNQADIDVVSLQHEFGIFGGSAGSHVLTLLRRLRMPVVTTFHTILADPDTAQRRVMEELIARSERLVVMARKGVEILRDVYSVPDDKIAIVLHGIPDIALSEPSVARTRLGLPIDRLTLMTFGLLSPGKGIETMIEAMPAIVARHPLINYLIVGATHPHLAAQKGERYRQSLANRVAELGVAGNVTFLDRFLELDDLITYIAACDIYVTPYLNPAQITSGTLAYGSGLGRPVVSTPYWHATEILGDGAGILVPFAEPGELAAAVNGLLDDPAQRQTMSARAREAGRAMTWPAVAEQYRNIFSAVRIAQRQAKGVAANLPRLAPSAILPPISTTHLAAMSDDTGLLQHAVLGIPARDHGYCIDDNVRALLFLADLQQLRPLTAVEARLLATYAAFIDHGWRADAACFRNFMSYERRWLDDVGSADAQGRAVWALAALALQGGSQSLGQWATTLVFRAAPGLAASDSPRAWAYGLLGLNKFLQRYEGHRELEETRASLAEKLRQRLADCAGPGWLWFEDELSYDNARLPQALIETGAVAHRPELVSAGLGTLDWLMAYQTAPEGHFRPVGTDSFGRYRLPPLQFDQQPLEAGAAVGACLSAARVTGSVLWTERAMAAFGWFKGENDLFVPVAEIETGACFDGLHFDRRNGNRGAESTLAYLLALAEVHLARRASTAMLPIAQTPATSRQLPDRG